MDNSITDIGYLQSTISKSLLIRLTKQIGRYTCIVSGNVNTIEAILQ